MKITRDQTIYLTKSELIDAIAELAQKNPEVIKIILKQKGKICCPFPSCCKEFPCKTLSCNADVCSNGYAYRMS
jgi:hypothetical protein